ncbi:transposase InsO family protein [Rhizobium aethiopicum]|nr:transposase InsO family protein [Rhizobium aethiopicum]
MQSKNRRSARCTRSKLASHGRPPVWQRENLCRFWRAIASGLTSEDAADRPSEYVGFEELEECRLHTLRRLRGRLVIATSLSRSAKRLHSPRMEGFQPGKGIKNGPALAGRGAGAVCDVISRTMTRLPEELRKSLTWDQCAEMSQHARLRIDTGLQTYFCDPQSPWQRGANENTNGLLHQYFPKGTDLSRFATLEWDDWFNNRRLLEPIGNIPPTEAEERYYAMLDATAMAAQLNQTVSGKAGAVQLRQAQ